MMVRLLNWPWIVNSPDKVTELSFTCDTQFYVWGLWLRLEESLASKTKKNKEHKVNSVKTRAL